MPHPHQLHYIALATRKSRQDLENIGIGKEKFAENLKKISKKSEKPLDSVRKVCYTMHMVEQNNQNTLTGRRKVIQ